MANPVLTIDADGYDDYGTVRLRWTNANKGANWYSWRLYRRLFGDVTWTLLQEYIVDAATYEHNDISVPANTAVEYSVVRVHLVAAVPTEEAHTPKAAFADGSHYWFMHPEDSTHLRLAQVTSDSFKNERDMAVHKLIGRGRKVDRGTSYGVVGSLAAQLRDRLGLTARQQLKLIELLCEDAPYLWMKNPFGDVYKVVLSDPQVERISGVGLNEYVDLTFDYTEVA